MPSQSISTDTHQQYDDQRWRRFESRFSGFWAIVSYFFAAVGVYNTYNEHPERIVG